jgi:hypothetical protein
MTGAAESANQSARQVATSEPVKVGARIGLIAYGVTHLLIAWLALQVALGNSGPQANQSGAFQELAQQSFGRVLLWVLVLGFVAVALWRLTQVIWRYRYVSDRAKKLRKRASSAIKVAVFVVLAVLAGQTAAGGGNGGATGGGGQQRATAGVLGLPGGQLIVGAAGTPSSPPAWSRLSAAGRRSSPRT